MTPTDVVVWSVMIAVLAVVAGWALVTTWSAATSSALLWLARWHARVTLRNGAIPYNQRGGDPTVWPIVVTLAIVSLVIAIIVRCGVVP